jgi:hypothetical protein
MKLANVTLPLTAMLFLSGNCLAHASSASMLDPYAYIQAPSRAEREQQPKKTKKIKVKRLTAKEPEFLDTTEKPPSSSKPAPVILSTDDSPRASKYTSSKEKVAAKVKPLEDPPAKEPKAEKISKKESDSDNAGFLDGIKQSTGGIAKSTKAVGSKIAEGFKSAGEKVKDGTAAAGEKMSVVPKKIGEAGEKVKDGGASVGGKVASGFKAAGGSLAAIPKAVGGAAEKVGSSTGDGAKKLVAAPAAGFGALGHGIGKLNPFHKGSDTTEVAEKPSGNSSDATVGGDKTASALKPVGKSKKSTEDVADSPQAEEKASSQVAEKAPTSKFPTAAEAKAISEGKTFEPQSVAKVEKKAPKSEDDSEKVAHDGVKHKFAPAPKAGIEATKAGLDATKEKFGAIGHGITKFNPFHKGSKSDAAEGQEPEAKTASKSVEPAGKSLQDATPASEQADQTRLGERITMPDDSASKMAAPPEAQPH